MPIEIIDAAVSHRPAWRSIGRGLRGRCPNCGKGHLFRGYLKPVPTCTVCGEDLSHQRSDDFAPYLTIVAVGHVVVPLMVISELDFVLPTAQLLAIALPLTALVALALLRPIKGGIIGLQWALRMHGFDGSANPDAPEPVLAFPNGSPPLVKS